MKADYLVIAGGRRPDTDPLNLDAAGVKTEEHGQIEIDEYQRTSADGVFAIGDLVRGPALAHKAEEEGVVAVETAAGHETEPVNIDLVPGATFCHPQVASVGMTEEQAKETGRQIKVGKFKLGGAGASVVYDDRAGPGQDRRRPRVRRDPRRPHRRQHRLRHDQRDRQRDGARGRLSGARADHPSASDDVGGGSRRRPRRRRLGDSRLGPMTTNRLEAFSDGVFAVAITLLVLEIDVPGGENLWHELKEEWPSFAAFVVSFWVIGIIWVNHHGVIDHLRRADRGVLYLNLLVLMTVVFIPFSTALLAEHLKSGADEEVAAFVYSRSFLAMGVSFGLLWTYVTSHREALGVEPDRRRGPPHLAELPDRQPDLRRRVAMSFVSPAAVLAIVALVAFYYVIVGMRSPVESG